MVITDKKITEIALKLMDIFKTFHDYNFVPTRDYISVLGFCLALHRQYGFWSKHNTTIPSLKLNNGQDINFYDYFNKNISLLVLQKIDYVLREELCTNFNLEVYTNKDKDLIYSELYEKIIFIVLKDFQGYMNELPKEIIHFIPQLYNHHETSPKDSIFIPFAGTGALLLQDNFTFTKAYEPNKQLWLIGILRLMFKNIDTSSFTNTTLPLSDNNSNIKHDLIVLNTPQVELFEDTQIDVASTILSIEYALCHIKSEGRVIAIIPKSFLSRNNDFSKIFFRNNHIHTIIQLPDSYEEIIVIFRENLHLNDSGIIMANLREVEDSDLWIEIYERIEKGDNRYGQNVSKENIVANNTILYPSWYIDSEDENRLLSTDIEGKYIEFEEKYYETELPDGYKCYKFSDFLSPIKKTPYIEIENIVEVVEVNKLHNNESFSYEAKTKRFNPQPCDVKSYFWLNDDLINYDICFLLDRNLILFTDLNAMYYCHQERNSTICAGEDIIPFQFNSSIIDPLFFCLECQREYVREQFSENLEDSYMDEEFPMKKFLNTRILLPQSLEKQKAIYNEAKKNYQHEMLYKLGFEENLRKKEGELIKEREKHNKYLSDVRHSMNNLFFHLNPALSSLNKSIEKLDSHDVNKHLLKKIKTDLNNVNHNVKRLREETKNLGLNDFIKEAEPINLLDIISDIENQHSENYTIESIIHNNINVNNGAIISFGRDNLFTVIEEIIRNAEKHGFKNKNNKYTIRFKLKLDAKSNNYILEISNNGEPMDKSIDIERFGTHGVKTIDSNGEGLGGHQIKTLIEHFKGSLDLIQDNSSTFPVKFIITLPNIK